MVSSIGSLPLPIEGIPINGNLYEFDSPERGALLGVDGVYGLGNVLTGKGNIRDSRINAGVVAKHIIESLLGSPDSVDDVSDALHAESRARAESLADRILPGDKLPPEQIGRILERVQSRWKEIGYGGDYRAWMEAHRPTS